MKWKNLVLIGLLSFKSLVAYDFDEGQDGMSAEQEEMLALDSEIEALLDDDELDQLSVGINEYEELSEMAQSPPLPGKEKQKSSLLIKNRVKQVPVDAQEMTSFAVEMDNSLAEDAQMLTQPVGIIDTIQEETSRSVQGIEINLRKVFSGAPIIYSILFLLSTTSVCVWLYSMLTIRSIEFLPPKLIKDLRTKLTSNQFDEALDLCVNQKHFFCKMLASGILARKHGLNVMLDSMKAEGKRSTVAFWQRINILNEIAIIAPMLGLLGTVLGMFYAFYDLNRSIESVSLLFDGLGISVGTTVAGLIVAILAMILYSIAKYRLVRILASVENEAQGFAALIDTHGPNYLQG